MNIADEIKNVWNRPNNGLIQLILINVAIFILMVLLKLIASLTGNGAFFGLIYDQFALPGPISVFIFKPWTLITYGFTHSLTGIMHILFNMLALYWFGRIFVEFLGSQKLINIYVIGAIGGGLFYLLIYNFFPTAGIYMGSGLVGASAAIFAISVAAATLVPDYTLYLIFLGPVKIKYLVGAYVLISLLMAAMGNNTGGELSHLGGAFIGYVYIKQLNRGREMGKWVFYFMDWVKGIFKPKPKIKVSYKSSTFGKKSSKTKTSKKSKNDISQAEIDAILDKISEKGYESLSKEEKEKLFNASNK